MYKKSRIVLLLVAITGCLIFLASCSGETLKGASDSGDGEGDGGATINFVYANSVNIDPYEEIFESFEEETGNKIELQPLEGGQEYTTMMKTRFNTEDYPDIFLMDPGTKQNTKFQAEETLVDWSEETDIIENLTDEAKTMQDDSGNIYGIPWGDFGVMGVYYNKEIFDEVGIEAPENYEELIEIAEEVKSQDYQPFYGAVDTGWPLQIFYFSGWVTDVDPFIESEDIDKLNENELKFTDIPEFKGLFEKQLSFMEKGFYQDDVMSGTYEEQIELFGTNELAMMFQLPDGITQLGEQFGSDFVEENVGFFPFPSEDDKGNATVTPPHQLMVPKEGDHPEEAKDLVEFMVSEDMLNNWYENVPGIPIYDNVESDLYPYQEEAESFIEEGNSEINIQNRLEPTFKDFDKILGNFFLEKDVEDTLEVFSENYIEDGSAKRLEGFEDE